MNDKQDLLKVDPYDMFKAGRIHLPDIAEVLAKATNGSRGLNGKHPFNAAPGVWAMSSTSNAWNDLQSALQDLLWEGSNHVNETGRFVFRVCADLMEHDGGVARDIERQAHHDYEKNADDYLDYRGSDFKPVSNPDGVSGVES